jgi:branched-chain amino acid transport system ATP-binding protein
VHGLSLDVAEGELVGLIGPNGAGKTTTLLAICGVVAPSSGDIRLQGESLLGLTPEAIVRRGISLVPEGRQIFTDLTVEENLIVGASVRSDRRAIQRDVEGMVERFPVLATYLKTSAGKLSGGEQQQLAIARALIARPRLVLLDEPSLGLAPLIVDRVFEIIDELRAEGSTILLVEQNATRTVKAADRTYVLRTGRLEAAGTRDELLARDDLAATYFGG